MGFVRFVGNARDLVVVIDATGTILALSDSAVALLGHPTADVVGSHIIGYLHPDDVPRAAELLAIAAEIAGTTEVIDARVRHADGRWIPFEFLPRTMLATDGIIVLTGRDVTERLRLEQERTAEEWRFRAVATAAPIVIFHLDRNGDCLFVNDRWTELTGQPAEEALGRGWMTCVARRHLQRLADVRSGTNRTGMVELDLYNASGDQRSVVARWEAIGQPTFADTDGYVATAEDVTERKALEARLTHQATHDVLTGLPNRVVLNEHLSHALARSGRTGEHIGVVLCDLDRFKVVNDSMGHETGDRLLVAVARRLQAAMRTSDVVGRFGGDEFVIIATDVNPASVREITTRLQAQFSLPFDIGIGAPYACSASIGLALSTPQATPETLLRDADVAMYRAKERGRGRSEEFDQRLRARALDRLSLESALPHAIEHDELVVLYQPIVRTETGDVGSLEALIRWDHPTRGRLAPESFIGLAEETGLILSIGEWILERACRDVLPLGELVVNVNLSAHQVHDPKLVDRVASVLTRTGLPANRLMLEITESVLLADTEVTISTLRRLKELGVSIAVDDFGTGYASLNYLSKLPVDCLKIDRSFVQGLGQPTGDTEIVRAVVALAHALGLRATAEGVETEPQLAQLRSLRCDLVQGYLFDYPVEMAVLRSRVPLATSRPSTTPVAAHLC